MPPSLPPQYRRNAEKVEVSDTRVSLSKDGDYGNATDTDRDAELVFDLLLRGTPEEPDNSNCLSNTLQQEITEDLPLYRGYDDKDGKDGKFSVSAVKDAAAVEGLDSFSGQPPLLNFEGYGMVLLTLCRIFRSLSRCLQLFDVDHLKLEAAYAKNALFLVSHSSCSRTFFLNGGTVRSRKQ